MAASIIEIYQQVAQHLGITTPTDINDGTIVSKELGIAYDQVRKQVLSRMFWLFATKTAVLASNIWEGNVQFRYSYALPTDFLVLVNIQRPQPNIGVLYEDRDNSQWEINNTGGKSSLLTNMTAGSNGLSIKYIADIQQVGLFPANFVELLVVRIAFKSCIKLTQSSERQAKLGQILERVEAEAISANDVQRSSQTMLASQLEMARISGQFIDQPSSDNFIYTTFPANN